jgi:ABC-2 type transport system ATP-binding protein
MTEVVASTRGLTKQYGPRFAIRDIDLELRAGEVFGFLGPNGAGKTTTIKCLLGLIAPTAGEVRLFGEPLDGNLPQLLRRVGAIVEAPAFYPYLSGRGNLRALARIDGLPETRVDEVLRSVDLLDAADRPFSTYSLGMKQRLGIAATLLRDPRLILLDEPTSGLDPAGQLEVRELIPRLAREGRTIFISSHQMHELQQICDRVAILKGGQKLAEGTVADLLHGGSSGAIDLRVADAEGAERVARALDWVRDVVRDGDRLTVSAPADRAAELNEALARAGFYCSAIRPRELSLEEFFLDVTGSPAQETGWRT